MAKLTIPHGNPTLDATLDDPGAVATYLAKRGLRLGHWTPPQLDPAVPMPDAALINALRPDYQGWMRHRELTDVHVLRYGLDPALETPHLALQAREHLHPGDECRWVVAGRALYWINPSQRQPRTEDILQMLDGRPGDELALDELKPLEPVFALLLEPGDWLVLPAGTAHWLDLGPSPLLLALAFQQHPDDARLVPTNSGVEEAYTGMVLV